MKTASLTKKNLYFLPFLRCKKFIENALSFVSRTLIKQWKNGLFPLALCSAERVWILSIQEHPCIGQVDRGLVQTQRLTAPKGGWLHLPGRFQIHQDRVTTSIAAQEAWEKLPTRSAFGGLKSFPANRRSRGMWLFSCR